MCYVSIVLIHYLWLYVSLRTVIYFDIGKLQAGLVFLMSSPHLYCNEVTLKYSLKSLSPQVRDGYLGGVLIKNVLQDILLFPGYRRCASQFSCFTKVSMLLSFPGGSTVVYHILVLEY